MLCWAKDIRIRYNEFTNYAYLIRVYSCFLFLSLSLFDCSLFTLIFCGVYNICSRKVIFYYMVFCFNRLLCRYLGSIDAQGCSSNELQKARIAEMKLCFSTETLFFAENSDDTSCHVIFHLAVGYGGQLVRKRWLAFDLALMEVLNSTLTRIVLQLSFFLKGGAVRMR